MKLIIGNKNYSSWSLRAWLAARQSGVSFEERTVHIDGAEWAALKRDSAELQPSAGKVPVLWDGDVVVWDSLAIMEYLADKVGRDRFWPKAADARATARAMVAEMHSSYLALRRACPMNVRACIGRPLDDAVMADVLRIVGLWAESRSRWGRGGPFLFGSFGAADIFYAPIVSRFTTYAIPVPGFAQAYMQAINEHAWMQEWTAAAQAEPWTIARFEVEQAA